MMATLPLISNSLSFSPQPSVPNHESFASPSTTLSFRSRRSSPPVLELSSMNMMKSCRSVSVVTRAGPPGTATFIFAAVFPLSLLVVTIISALKIDDIVEQKFLEELAVNEEILEAEEGGDEESNNLEEKTEVPRTRNRPKREVEVSSM